jgi:HK97 family phage major capsid protein
LSSLQSKTLEVINNVEGGFIVSLEISDRIVTRQFDTTPMRQIAIVMSISSDAIEMLRDTNEPVTQWISETGVPADTNEGGMGRVRIPVHELYPRNAPTM